MCIHLLRDVFFLSLCVCVRARVCVCVTLSVVVPSVKFNAVMVISSELLVFLRYVCFFVCLFCFLPWLFKHFFSLFHNSSFRHFCLELLNFLITAQMYSAHPKLLYEYQGASSVEIRMLVRACFYCLDCFTCLLMSLNKFEECQRVFYTNELKKS